MITQSQAENINEFKDDLQNAMNEGVQENMDPAETLSQPSGHTYAFKKSIRKRHVS